MKSKNIMINILLIGIAFSMVILIVTLQIRMKALEQEQELLEKLVEDYRLTVQEMEYEMNLPREDYIEKYAREVLGYHKYSDIIFKEEIDE